MSYSFTVRAATKAEAISAVGDKLAEVVTQQPVHAADVEQAQAAAAAFVGLLLDDDSKDVCVSMNGYVSYTGPSSFIVASVSVNASLVGKLA